MLTVFVSFGCFSSFFCDLFIVFRGEDCVYSLTNEDFYNKIFTVIFLSWASFCSRLWRVRGMRIPTRCLSGSGMFGIGIE